MNSAKVLLLMSFVNFEKPVRNELSRSGSFCRTETVCLHGRVNIIADEEQMRLAVEDGDDVLGYIMWSAIDVVSQSMGKMSNCGSASGFLKQALF